jgi:2-polyprenyl-6-methoxyphenol hydroxylase-like FAD-dependent oxidoreductase
MPTPQHRPSQHRPAVVVIGGSISGLLAAAACSPHARSVVVLERDAITDQPAARPGTPQASHAHGVLASGRGAMETLLPGLTDQLVAAGAISHGDIGSNGRWWIGGGRLADCSLGVTGIAVSRPLLEHTVRQRVRDLPNVEFRARTDVLSLARLSSRQRVDGVCVQTRHPDGTTSDADVLGAELVIDASGRSGRAARWFQQHGWAVPREDRVTVGVRYATTHVAAEPDDLGGRSVTVSAATPQNTRGGAAIRQEDNTWIVLLFGYGEEQPPVDSDGFRAFARTLVSPDIASLLNGRELEHEPQPYRFPDLRRRHFDAATLPTGYAPIGDAICSFDPTFGQGMSVAALQAAALADEMPRVVHNATAYLAAADRIADRAWTIAVGADLQLPGVQGTARPAPRPIASYLRRLQRVARHDPAVAAAFMRVTNLMEPPSSLLSPAIAVRVLQPRRDARVAS